MGQLRQTEAVVDIRCVYCQGTHERAAEVRACFERSSGRPGQPVAHLAPTTQSKAQVSSSSPPSDHGRTYQRTLRDGRGQSQPPVDVDLHRWISRGKDRYENELPGPG